MHDLRFFITDVFGWEKYSGNQLATFLNGDQLSEDEMQKIAREINFSETTFILSDNTIDGSYAVRIFTPAKEIDFAGHPTLGTAFIIKKHILKQHAGNVVLNLNAGKIPVTFSSMDDLSTLWMDQIEPMFGSVLNAGIIAEMLSLPADALDGRYPIQEVSTGLPHMIVPLKNLEALKNASIVKERYFEAIRDISSKCILLFCPEGRDNSHTLSVRMFADFLGIPEDPATGSGNGCLAGYLVKHKYLGSSTIDICVGQGHEIGRPSLLMLKAEELKDGRIHISVGGRVIPIAEGFWYL
jgi:trans-2,3-dihydro-3-hydroxyanthranilate isomerase